MNINFASFPATWSFSATAEEAIAITGNATSLNGVGVYGSNSTNAGIGVQGVSSVSGGIGVLAYSGNSGATILQGNNIAGTVVFRVQNAGILELFPNLATPAGGSAKMIGLGSAGPGVYFGSGAPSVTAPQGSLYLRTDGSATNNRAYINLTGSTTWTPLTTAA